LSDILPGIVDLQMGIAASLEQERAEVELVLESGLFEKAPRLGRFFRYVCERHLNGHSEGVKEYSIAVEALGRPPDFDPKKDSIVRVEAHRLRKRLEEYYRGAGADRPLQIAIPSGQYRPEFRYREGKQAETIDEQVSAAGQPDRPTLGLRAAMQSSTSTIPHASRSRFRYVRPKPVDPP